MTYSTKRKALILLGLVMFVTMIIAASLPQMDLQPGMPLPRLENDQVVLAPIEEEPLVAMSVNEFFKVLFFLLLAGTILYLIYKMIRGIGWMDLGSFVQPVMIVGLIAGIIIFLIMLMPKVQNDLPMELPLPTSAPPISAPLGPVPAVLFWLVGIGLLVSGILLGIWIFAPSSRYESIIDLVGLEAENALQSLRTGWDLKDVIVKCYRQMSLVLEREKGIERKEFDDYKRIRKFIGNCRGASRTHSPIDSAF